VSKIVIDRDVFVALASDTRIEILKQLDERRKTLSEITKKVDCNKSAVHKHLSKLVEAGLVKKEETEHKWVYYSLTGKGKSILHPEKFKLTLLLSSAIVSLAGAIISAFIYLKEKSPEHIKIMGNESYGADAVGGGSGGGGTTPCTTPYFIIIFVLASIILFVAAIFVWRKERREMDELIKEK